ncbi:MAG TPA: glycosyltransferase [Gemmataceae bacterium]|nr:glycosyltransferase [Gemmataceae bacterium]
MPLVSVVIPAHNRETFLPAAVESVLSQTFTDWELLIVDDGSDDSTARVAREYAGKDLRIRCLRHEHRKGAQAARNSGIRAAQGPWIAFLDSDDRWLADSLEVRLQLATTSQVAVVHSECYILKPDEASPSGGPAGEEESLERMGLRPLQGQIYQEVLRQPGPMFQGMLVTREALARIGYLDESIRSYQEWDTTIRLAKHHVFAFVPQPTFVWNFRNPSSLSRSLTGNAAGYLQVMAKHRWAILRVLGPKALAFHYQTAGYLFRKAGDEARARHCLVRAYLWWPFRASIFWAGARHFLKWRRANHSGGVDCVP